LPAQRCDVRRFLREPTRPRDECDIRTRGPQLAEVILEPALRPANIWPRFCQGVRQYVRCLASKTWHLDQATSIPEPQALLVAYNSPSSPVPHQTDDETASFPEVCGLESKSRFRLRVPGFTAGLKRGCASTCLRRPAPGTVSKEPQQIRTRTSMVP